MVPRPPELTQVYGLVEAPVLAGPHLVLADARHDDRARRAGVPDDLDHRLRLERRPLLLGLVVQGEPLLPSCDRAPTMPERSGWGSPLAAEHSHQLFDDQAAVAYDRDVGPADLAQLRRVDVNMDDLRRRGRKQPVLPVTRSSKRVPRAISRSDSCMAVIAA